MKPSNAANDNLIDRTIETWRPRLGRDLRREDARQIVENVTGFFSILAEWSRAELPDPANDNGVDREVGGIDLDDGSKEVSPQDTRGGPRS